MGLVFLTVARYFSVYVYYCKKKYEEKTGVSLMSFYLLIIRDKKNPGLTRSGFFLAERQGFEPWVPLLTHTRSRRANSTTLASLLKYYRPFCRNSQACQCRSAPPLVHSDKSKLFQNFTALRQPLLHLSPLIFYSTRLR